ncbi:MAG: PmoA family protein [Saprospiraceae bacterium]
MKNFTFSYYPLIVVLLGFHVSACFQAKVTAEKSDGTYTIRIDEQAVFSYQFEVLKVPLGEDSIYNRGGFVHPLRSLSGKILTLIRPKDHLHHFGIWNPWTHTLFEGDTLDFWNLDKGEGTIVFDHFIKEEKDGFSAKLHHVVLKGGKYKNALEEIQIYKVQPVDSKTYLVDFTSEYKTASPSSFKILEYRYGGFTYRATQEFDPGTLEVRSSVTAIRDSIDGKKADWCLVPGEIKGEAVSLLLMGHPDNFNAPQPLRVWPEGKHPERLMVNFAPTKFMDWKMEVGKDYKLKYRMVVSDRKMGEKDARRYFEEYQNLGNSIP